MSQLTAFAKAAATLANPVIGAESVTIGDASYDAILNESETSRDMEIPGFRPMRSLRAVFPVDSAPAGDNVGKVATARGTAYRVARQQRGACFVTLELEQTEKA